jgi:hypothetical protein
VGPLWLECEVLTGFESVSAGRFVRRDRRRRSRGGPSLTPAARTVIPTAPHCSFPYSYGDQLGFYGSFALLMRANCAFNHRFPCSSARCYGEIRPRTAADFVKSNCSPFTSQQLCLFLLTYSAHTRCNIAGRAHERDCRLRRNGTVLPGACEVGAAKQRKMDRAGRALARAGPGAGFVASSKETAPPAGNERRAHGNATAARLTPFQPKLTVNRSAKCGSRRRGIVGSLPYEDDQEVPACSDQTVALRQ